MVCKTCGCELGAIRMRMVVENDTTPDKETKLFTEHDWACKNKHCSQFEVVVETTKTESPLG